MDKDLAKVYNPKEVEDRIYDFWTENDLFHSEPDDSKEPYTIVIPPPNITGKLHMGHALDETLQDILIRFKRMKGFNTLWLPGTDHASIATEAKIVEAMRKEGLSKEDIGREEFLKRAMDWKEKYGGTIINQIKKLGASCDWKRLRFTMDKEYEDAIKEFFCNLYERGLIYRGERIINWCPHCRTSISDAEVEFSETNGNFYHIKYEISDGSGYVELATTRPETLLGDTAIAVNPSDSRYVDLVGKKVIVPIVNREIPVIADEYVETDFGTGVVKITPAHDPSDFEVGRRHNLEVIHVIDENGRMNENAGEYKGLSINEAREAIVNELGKKGSLIEIEPIVHNVGTCYRCNSTIEPIISKQWFVKMKPLAKEAIDVVKNEEIKFIPDRFKKVYFNWMENIKDWCISRQLWWGHRIPVWYCNDCEEIIVSKEDSVTKCPKCGSHNLRREEDTLDTWFSSALWPFATLGWPKETEDLKYFYPTSTLVTGYDIIFFWVARMIFSGLDQMKQPPFKNIFIHGIIRDSQGRKMSKSLGNGIDPLQIINEFGADALRFSLATGNSPGNDMRYSEEKVTSSRNFANKIWNAVRFIRMNIEGHDVPLALPENLALEDKWIISSLNSCIKEINDNIEKFELGIAVQKIYDFIWDEFCDWYIEIAKIRLADESEAQDVRKVLVWVMINSLKMLHPFMPFITEELYLSLPHDEKSISISKFPEYNDRLNFSSDENNMRKVMDVIRAIRNRRNEMNVPPSKKTPVFIATNDINVFDKASRIISKLAYSSKLEIDRYFDIPNSITIVVNDIRIYIPTETLIDKDKEIARLQKELDNCQKELQFANSKLNNVGFISKAPESVINAVKENAKIYSEKIKVIESEMKSFLEN